MSFTCPQCGRTSHGPEDERQGYCGACRAFTRGTVHDSAEAMFGFLRADGFQFTVGPSLAAGIAVLYSGSDAAAAVVRSLAEAHLEASGALGQWYTGLVTGSQRNPVPGNQRGPSLIAGDDDYPWADPMQWSPGDVEW